VSIGVYSFSSDFSNSANLRQNVALLASVLQPLPVVRRLVIDLETSQIEPDHFVYLSEHLPTYEELNQQSKSGRAEGTVRRENIWRLNRVAGGVLVSQRTLSYEQSGTTTALEYVSHVVFWNLFPRLLPFF
jgi:hypothetical protein